MFVFVTWSFDLLRDKVKRSMFAKKKKKNNKVTLKQRFVHRITKIYKIVEFKVNFLIQPHKCRLLVFLLFFFGLLSFEIFVSSVTSDSFGHLNALGHFITSN